MEYWGCLQPTVATDRLSKWFQNKINELDGIDFNGVSKDLPKYRYEAHCCSEKCCSFEYLRKDGSPVQKFHHHVVKDLDRSYSICPDCNHYLYWHREEI